MSVLASNMSQEVNGYHGSGEVSKDIMGHMCTGYFKQELHISYVTNGVHFPTRVASNMRKLYSEYFADAFNGHTYDIDEWQGTYNIPMIHCEVREAQRQIVQVDFEPLLSAANLRLTLRVRSCVSRRA